MGNALIASCIVVWFPLLLAAAMRDARAPMPPADLPWAVPLVLSATFAFAQLVFNVPREDGTAVLEQGLSASNIMTVVIAMTAALYVVGVVCIRRSVALLPFSADYRPYTLMIALDLLSGAWSVVPTYTLYRCFELIVFYTLAIVVFDRVDIRRRLGLILALYILSWLVVSVPAILGSLAAGIVFSSAKNNTVPIVCSTLLLWSVFEPNAAHRKMGFALGAVGFVIAGSAASTGALICAVIPACLIASPRPGRRIGGFVLGLLIVLVFGFLIVGLSAFPELVDVLSAVLQKPADELRRATGRNEIWPIFISATRDHMFGSGFSAADRFVQLLVPAGSFPDTFVRDQFHFGSSHNMFLSAWAGTGVVGLCFAAAVLGGAMHRAMRLDIGGRRLVLSVVVMLILNGLTTPGIFQDWGPMNFAFVAMLAYTRVGALGAAARATSEAWSARAFRPAEGLGRGVAPLTARR